MDPSLEIFSTWVQSLREKQGLTTPLIVDAGCTEAANAESELLSKEYIEGYVNYNSCTLTEQYGILEPVNTLVLSTYYIVNNGNNGTTKETNEENNEEEKKDIEGTVINNDNSDPSSSSSSLSSFKSIDAIVWKTLQLISETNTDIVNVLNSSATHIGIGGAIGPGGHIVIVINLLERRAHILGTDSTVVGGTTVHQDASIPLSLRSARILSADPTASHHHSPGVRLTVLANAGPNVPITHARIAATPVLLSETSFAPITLETKEIVDAETNANVPLANTIAWVRPRSTVCEGEIVVHDITTNDIVHDDDGNTVLFVPLTQIYANPSSCAGRYVIDIFVDENNSGTTQSASSANTGNTIVSESKETENETKEGEESKENNEESSAPTDTVPEPQNTAEVSSSPANEMVPSQASSGTSSSVFATRFVINIKDHDVTTAVADLESLSLPISIVPTPLSEIAVGLGAPEGLPETFLPQSLPVVVHTNALARRLPLIACGSATPGVPSISHILLISGNTEEDTIDQLPPGYEHIPFNIAAELAGTLDALPLSNISMNSQTGSITEIGEQSSVDNMGESSELTGGNIVQYDVEPPFVFLAVLRDGSGLPCQHMALTAVVSLPGIPDLPSVTVPHGYSSQMIDIGVRTLGINGLHDHRSTEAEDTVSAAHDIEPIRRLVRVALTQTTDVDVVQAVASVGTGITIGAPSSEGYSNDQGEQKYDTSAEDAEEAAAAAAAAYEEDREELLHSLEMAMQEQENLKKDNMILQKQLAVYFFNRLSEEDRERTSAALQNGTSTSSHSSANSMANAGAVFAAAERDRKYRELLDVVSVERGKTLEEMDQYDERAMGLQYVLDEKKARLEAVLRAYQSFKHEISRGAAHSHTGKHLPSALIDQYEKEELTKAEEVADAQLKNIYAAGQVTKIENELAKREQLGDGLAIIDFEQLKIENTTLVEKIEDRNEEVTKLRKKTQSAVQVLTHVREKLHFVAGEVGRLTTDLNEIEKQVSEQRTTLASGKKFRDTTRLETIRAKQAQGFAYNDRLAIDYEVRKRSVLQRKDELKRLQDLYHSNI